MMFDMNRKRWYSESRLIANAGINIVANEEMPPIPNHVVEAFDKYGLLFWETLFPCSISYPGREKFKYPLDAGLAVRGAQDMIKRYRHHASLALWAFTNEVMLREEIYTPVRNLFREMVPSAPFIPTTCIRWDVDSLTPYIKPDLPLGTTDISYPGYNWQPDEYYYKMVLKVKDQMLRNEMGCPSVPVLSSMQKMIFNLGKGEKNALYPLDSVWAYHGAWDTGNGESGYAFKDYDDAIRNYYGQPETVADYIRKAQYVNAGCYRAMYEAANHRMWDITQGVLIWKINSIWPTVVWQIYDWFLNPTSAYYFTQKALEPIHIQLNEHDFTVSVINTQYKELKDYSVSVKVLDFDLNTKWEKEETFSMGENQYKELFKLPQIKGLTPVYFVKLELKDRQGKTVSDNFYWFSTKPEPDFRQLSKLKPVDLKMDTQTVDEDTEYLVKVEVENASDRLAFMNRLMVCKGEGGEEVLPTIWSDNFFTLLPGEQKLLTASVAKADLNGKKPVVVQDKY
jgi:exo-1,4-beta-D-glucosaminidase